MDVPARAFYEFVGSVHPAIGPSGTLEYDVVVEIKPCHGVLTVDDVCHADKTPSLGNSESGRCVRWLSVPVEFRAAIRARFSDTEGYASS